MTHREIVAIVATGLIVLVMLGFAGAWWLIGYRDSVGYDQEHAAHKVSRSARDGSPDDGPGSLASGGEKAICPGPGSEPYGATGPVPAPRDTIPNLGKFVADEPSHVHQRRLEPLRSTGGYIPELADDCHWPDCSDSGACDYPGHQCQRVPSVLPASTSPGAGQDVTRPLAVPDEIPGSGPAARPGHSYPALVFPPAGGGPEPPGPARDSGPLGDDGDHAGSSPGVATGTGPGDLFALLPDDEAFLVIRWEFARLRKMVAQPYKLSEWRSAA